MVGSIELQVSPHQNTVDTVFGTAQVFKVQLTNWRSWRGECKSIEWQIAIMANVDFHDVPLVAICRALEHVE